MINLFIELILLYKTMFNYILDSYNEILDLICKEKEVFIGEY